MLTIAAILTIILGTVFAVRLVGRGGAEEGEGPRDALEVLGPVIVGLSAPVYRGPRLVGWVKRQGDGRFEAVWFNRRGQRCGLVAATLTRALETMEAHLDPR